MHEDDATHVADHVAVWLLRALPYLGPAEWAKSAVLCQNHLRLGLKEVQRLGYEAGWLEKRVANGEPTLGDAAPTLGDAARNGLLHIVFARLRALDEDPNKREAKHPKYTPLHRATSGGNRHVVRLLLQQKANVGARDRLGFTALHFATNHGAALVSDLLAAGAEANAVNLAGLTPLHSAAGLGAQDVCLLLLDARADAAATAQGKLTPAAMARRAAERRFGEDRSRLEAFATQLELSQGVAEGNSTVEEFAVHVVRTADSTIGLKYNYEDCGLRIVKILEGGLAAEWNYEHPDRQIKDGDYIVEVNGSRGDSDVIYPALAASFTCNLVIRREVQKAGPVMAHLASAVWEPAAPSHWAGLACTGVSTAVYG